MAKLDFNRLTQVTLAALTLGLAGGLAIIFLQRSKTEYLTLAAGTSSGESYILGNALKTIVERHYPRVRITLLETGGTVENLQMLEDGRAQLATAQADIAPGPRARALAVLYDDTFQLLVAKDSQAQNLVDLRGLRIALAQSGGQYQSFLRVVEHFGLQAADFHFVGTSDANAGEAFLKGQADAIFRVRAIGDPSIEQLVQSGRVRFLPIEHAAAMKIKHPSFEAALIPVGAYLGNPPVPNQDVPTVAVHRSLLARENANVGAIRAVTEVLMERRQEMMEEIPARMTEVRLLLVQVRRPEPQAGLGPACILER
jgi:TRAP transporter TAXI family solute receptor